MINFEAKYPGWTLREKIIMLPGVGPTRADFIAKLTAPIHSAKEVNVYSDGAYDPRIDVGGWAAVILAGARVIELGGREESTTVNRMELRGPLEALRWLAPTAASKKLIRIRSDSLYVVNTMTKWATKWEKRGWIKDDGKPAKNVDLITAIRALEKQFVKGVVWEYTPGHAGVAGNERADEISEGFIQRQPELHSCLIKKHPYDFTKLMKPSPKPKYFFYQKQKR